MDFLTETPVKDSPENAQKEIERALKWTRMLSNWETTYRKESKKIQRRCEKGIPPRVRGQAWKLLSKSTVDQLPVRKLTEYSELLREQSDDITQINRDINRTFPKNILLMQKGGRQALFNVLKANAVYNKDVGYCQGMGFVSALLLMYMEEEDAFWVLVRLCSGYDMATIWKTGFPGLVKCFFMLDKMMSQFYPKIHEHLRSQNCSMSMYGTQWFITIYLYNLPFPVALRIWDVVLFEGFTFVYAIALALIKLFEDVILELDGLDELFTFLTSFKTNKKPITLDPDIIIKTAIGLKDKIKKSLKSLEREFVLHNKTEPKKNGKGNQRVKYCTNICKYQKNKEHFKK